MGQQQQTVAGSVLRRMIMTLAVAGVMAVIMLNMAAPAFARSGSGGGGPGVGGHGGGSHLFDVPAGPHEGHNFYVGGEGGGGPGDGGHGRGCGVGGGSPGGCS
jgi:hypothetical protein